MLRGSSDPTQCREPGFTSGCFLGGAKTDGQEEQEMSISDFKNPAGSPAGKKGEVSRKWLSD